MKKSNLLIFGMHEEDNENIYEKVVEFFKVKLQITDFKKSEISCVFRFGRVKESNPRPVLVKFLALYRKSEVLKNGFLLKNTCYSICNDLSPEEREIQKVLRKHLQEAKKQNLKATIKGNKLLVNNETYTVEELIELEKANVAEEITKTSKVGIQSIKVSQFPVEKKTIQQKKRSNSERNEEGSSRNLAQKTSSKINSVYVTRSQYSKK